NDWLLFMDADCVPAANLLEAYYAEPIGDDCGALAGEIIGDPAQRGFLARYARSRRFLSQADGLLGPQSGAAVTGNVLLRRAALASSPRAGRGGRRCRQAPHAASPGAGALPRRRRHRPDRP